MKKKPLEPRKDEEEESSRCGRRNQVLDKGSNAKDWLFLEEVLWRPKRKNQGWEREGEVKVGEEMREYQSLQTEEARRMEGIGRDERMSSVRSTLRVLMLGSLGLWSDIEWIWREKREGESVRMARDGERQVENG